jgi:predicted GIY-YIG superfamily endonuclease
MRTPKTRKPNVQKKHANVIPVRSQKSINPTDPVKDSMTPPQRSSTSTMTKAPPTTKFAPGWQTYLLLCADGRYHCGITSDLQTQIRDQAEGRGDHPTNSAKVVALVWHEPHADEKSAAVREAQIKHWGHNQKACLAHSTPPYDTMGEATWVPLDNPNPSPSTS